MNGSPARARTASFAAAVVAVGLAGSCVASAVTPREPGAAAAVSVPPVASRTAESFLDSVGVNAHWAYPDTPYGSAYPRVRQLLVDSGIRHVRGEAFRAADLAAEGVRTTVLVDLALDGTGEPGELVTALEPLVRSGAVVAVEGPNEPDKFWAGTGRTYRGLPAPAGPLLWQEELHRAVEGSPTLSGLTVIGPSLGETYWDGGHPYPPGTFADLADWGNFHPYPAGNPFTRPEPYAGIERYYWHSNFPSVALDEYPIELSTYRPAFGDLPMAATETGYSTYALGPSEEVQGRYLPRLFLEHFRLGIQRTYTYELVDSFDDPTGSDREAHFGMVRNDLTPKPAYYAVRSLLDVLAEPQGAPATEPAPLDYTLLATPPPGYDADPLHHLVLSKSDGSHVVILWHEVSANDTSGLGATPPQPLRELDHPPVGVELDLGVRAAGATVQTIDRAGVLQPSVTDLEGTALNFSVPDRVTLVTVPAA